MPQGVERTEEQALAYIKPILPLLQRGMSTSQSCDYAKISIDTVNHYQRRWESVYLNIREAKMVLIATASDTVAKHAKDDPKIALEILKRRSKSEWGDNIDFTTGGEQLKTALVEFTNDPIKSNQDTDTTGV